MVSAQYSNPKAVLDNPSACFHSPARDPLPLSALPAQVQAAEGKLTLWADYAAAEQTFVPLYLVNRTSAEISLGTQDSDLEIKLEFKNERGAWTRAQAHISSFCGNSSYVVKLPPGHFFELGGYRAAKGAQHPVRYTSYGSLDLSSNTGEGLVSPEDIYALERDVISGAKIPYPLYETISLCSRESTTPPGLAECLAILRVLPSLERNEVVLDAVRELRSSLAKEPAMAERQEVIQNIDKVLSHQWPSNPADSASVFQVCVRSIFDGPDASPSSSKLPDYIAWRTLAKLADSYGTPGAEGIAAWKPILAKAEQVLREPGNERSYIKYSAKDILCSRKIVDPLIPDSTIIAWLKSPPAELLKAGAQGLIRRGHMQQLVQIARDLSPEAQMSVLGILPEAHWLARVPVPDGSSRPPMSPEEKRYWTHCFSTQPLESVRATLLRAAPPEDAVRLPLREFLVQEAKRGMAAEKDYPLDKQRADLLPLAIRLLGDYQNAEDDALLRDLTKHRGTSPPQDASDSTSSGKAWREVASEATKTIQWRAEALKASQH